MLLLRLSLLRKSYLLLGRVDLCCTFLQQPVSYLDKANG